MALVHPIRCGISAETCGLDDMLPADDIGSGPYTKFILIKLSCIIDAFFTYQELVLPWRCVGWYVIIISCPVSIVF